MTPSTTYPALAQLGELVHKQRRLVAGQMRIAREEKQLRVEMDAMLERAGVEVVVCPTPIGDFEVRRAVGRDSHRYASVTPVTSSSTPNAT